MTTSQTFIGDIADLTINETARDGAGIARIMQTVKNQVDASEDIVAETGQIAFALVPGEEGQPPEPRLNISLPNDFGTLPLVRSFPLLPNAHMQAAELLGIPRDYYRRMQEHNPQLLVDNMQAWVTSLKRERHLIRAMGGHVRAIVSSRFAPFESYDLVGTTLQAARATDSGFIRAQISPTRFALSIVKKDWPLQVTTVNNVTRGRDGTVIPLITVRNSDTGNGGLSVTIGLYTATCGNCMVWEKIVDKRHIGTAFDIGVASLESRRLAAKSVWQQVKETIEQAWQKEKFEQMVAAMETATQYSVVNPVAAATTVGKALAFSEDEVQALINEMVSPTANVPTGYGTVYDFANALTAVSQKLDHSRSEDIEEYAGVLLRTGGQGIGKRVGFEVRARTAD